MQSFASALRSAHLNNQRRVEGLVLDHPFRRITARIGDHAGVADAVVEAVVHMAVQPQGRLPAVDLWFQVGNKTRVQRRTGELRGDAATCRCEVRDNHRWPICKRLSGTALICRDA